MQTDHVAAVNVLIEFGDFTRFNEIFTVAKAGVVARGSGVDVRRLNQAIRTKLTILTLEELFGIAAYFRITEEQMMGIVLNEIAARKKKLLKFEGSKVKK